MYKVAPIKIATTDILIINSNVMMLSNVDQNLMFQQLMKYRAILGKCS